MTQELDLISETSILLNNLVESAKRVEVGMQGAREVHDEFHLKLGKEEFEMLRDLQVKCARYAIERLKEEVRGK